MKRGKEKILSKQGFTIIELLTSMAIVGALAGIAISAFTVYQKEALYMAAVSDFGNAKQAAFLGLIESPDGYDIPLTWTGKAGGPVPGQL